MENLEKQEASPSCDNVEGRKTKSPKKPRIVYLPKRDGKRRGRPSKAGTNSARGAIIQPRRTRARCGNKPAKISEIESDEGASLNERTTEEEFELTGADQEKVTNEARSVVNRPRSTRSWTRSKPANILEDESEEGASAHEQNIKENFEVGRTIYGSPEKVNMHTQEAEMKDVLKDSESLDRGEAVEQEVVELSKLETFLDPVQAMLLNMIPSLATNKDDSADTIVEDKKPERANPLPEEYNAKGVLPLLEDEKAQGLDPKLQEGSSSFQPPAKKKKVSYKDAANELLRDW